MKQISLVLPFALPPPELATDLIRALQAPALAALVGKGQRSLAAGGDDRLLPHETWLGRRLGTEGFAAAAMRAFGLELAGGRWFVVQPGHIEIARSHLLLNDPRQLALSDQHARALFELARPYFEEIGLQLAYGDASTWFLRADAWTDFSAASPDAAAGQDVSHYMPRGAQAIAFRKLQNEIQMLWYEHAVNLERERQGLRAVNAIWPWAPSNAAAGPLPPLLAIDAPAWLAAMAQPATLQAALQSGEATVYIDSLSGPALSGDWSAWLAALGQLEQDWFAPLRAALAGGKAGQLQLVLTNREQIAEFNVTPFALRKFWRGASLTALCP